MVLVLGVDCAKRRSNRPGEAGRGQAGLWLDGDCLRLRQRLVLGWGPCGSVASLA